MPDVFSLYVSALSSIAPLVMCGGVGFIWGKSKLRFDIAFISTLVTLVGVPALIFHTLYTTAIDTAALVDIGLSSVVALGLAAALCAATLKLFKKPIRANIQLATFPNSGNLGLPLSTLAFGSLGLSAALVFFAICTFLHNTLGVRTLTDKQSSSKGTQFIVISAALLAIIAKGLSVPVPEWTLNGLGLIGSITVPLMLFSLGYSLANISSEGMQSGSFMAILRLAAGCIGAVLACWLLGTPGLLAAIIILQMTMPCAVLSYMYVSHFQPDQKHIAASAVLVSTIIFLLASPLFIAALQHFYL